MSGLNTVWVEQVSKAIGIGAVRGVQVGVKSDSIGS